MHFILRKDAAGAVTLQDKSSNGTFVNGREVGKERTTMLAHNDVIGMSGTKVKHFAYMNSKRD